MITNIRSGFYKLIETKHNTKVLYLDDEVYAWIEPKDIGEILVTSRRQHRTDCILGVGRFNMLKVEEEPLLSDHVHLELEVGRGVWQGYLLLTGLPDADKPKARIIPTGEIITGNRKYTNRKNVHLHAVSGK